jgi:hypothetical protein
MGLLSSLWDQKINFSRFTHMKKRLLQHLVDLANSQMGGASKFFVRIKKNHLFRAYPLI